jgi:hypothetical protein
MFCACAVIVLILVSFVLGAHVYVLLYFCLLSSHVFVFATFEQVVCPPSSAYQSVYCELMRRLCAGFRLFVDLCTAFMRAFVYSSTCMPPSRGLSFNHRLVRRLCMSFCLFIDVCATFVQAFFFMFENLILIYSLSFRLCVCALELFALGLGIGVIDVVCLPNR